MQRDPGMADLKAMMEAVFIRLGEAYEVLKNSKTRGAYESDLAARAPRVPQQQAAQPDAPAPPPRQDPEILVRRAEGHMKEAKFWDAIQLLEQAEEMATGRPKQKTRVLLARCYLQNPKWLHQAEDVLQKAVKEDPSYAEPFMMLGIMYKNGGLKSRALGMFRKVVELKPDYEEAAKEVEALEPKAEPAEEEPPPGGLLKKFFGRS
jgi:tetratricopeptide (TPR) repeat protein